MPAKSAWKSLPFLRISISFSMGILFQGYFPELIQPGSPVFKYLIALHLFNLIYSNFLRMPELQGITLLSGLFVCANLICHQQNIQNSPYWFGQKQYNQLIINVESTQITLSKQQLIKGRVQAINNKGNWIAANGRILCRLRKIANFTEGTQLLLLKRPEFIPTVPTKDSYTNYLAAQQIHHSMALKEHEYHVLFTPKTNPRLIAQLTKNIHQLLEKFFPDIRQRGMAKALLIGDRQELDKILTNAFTNTGVIHVIAISGMHLGLIYSLLLFSLQPFKRNHLIRNASYIIIIILMWLFTMICGSTPSVVRSAIMFTFLITAHIFSKESHQPNILAASAFIMLLFQPRLLFDIGFQLSYAAVASLLIYQKYINALITSSNLIIQQTWNIISTTLAAQILTTPLVLFHFHQFPVLFLFANIIAIPLSSLILILLIAICLTHPFHFISNPLVGITRYLIDFMNYQMLWLNQIPHNTINAQQWNSIDLICSFLVIITATFFLQNKKGYVLLLTLTTLLLWKIVSILS